MPLTSPLTLSCLRAAARRMALDGLLCTRHEDVRGATAAFLERVRAAPAGRAWVLGVLGDGMAQADARPRHCAAYYSVFAQAVAASSKKPDEVCRGHAPGSCGLTAMRCPTLQPWTLKAYTTEPCWGSAGCKPTQSPTACKLTRVAAPRERCPMRQCRMSMIQQCVSCNALLVLSLKRTVCSAVALIERLVALLTLVCAAPGLMP